MAFPYLIVGNNNILFNDCLQQNLTVYLSPRVDRLLRDLIQQTKTRIRPG